MPNDIMRVGVVMLRRPPVTRWGTGELRPLAVLPGEPEMAPHTLVSRHEGGETWYLGSGDIEVWSGDTSHHRDNLASGRPSVWVALRGMDPAEAELVCITVDPYEGEGLASDTSLTVEAVAMPEAVQAFVQHFIAAHHVEMPFEKRKRTPTSPDAMVARAPRILQPEDTWQARKGRGHDT